MALFLLVVLAAVVLGFVGLVLAVPHFLAIAIVIIVADLLLFGLHWARESDRHPAR
ncbi:hypothetical protein AB0C59_19470 [Streptomyces sp. NPDC048664]|uniref:hypothetical protein n=1 Tax=Streptomyces sp. NPDC048664 TaxID=3154505 RepID=UPI0034404907